jgi:hypothetical protein
LHNYWGFVVFEDPVLTLCSNTLEAIRVAIPFTGIHLAQMPLADRRFKGDTVKNWKKLAQ